MYLHTPDDKDDPSLQPLMADVDYKSAGGIQPGRLSDDEVDAGRAASLTEALHVEGFSLFEKKCVLINREIDAMGMGRYQWYVWCLCGFGYFLDLLWAMAFGLVLGPVQQEFGFGNDQSGNISTSFSAGLTAGAFVWGVLSDIIGWMKESPKYLVYRGQDEKAVEVIRHIAKVNGQESKLRLESFEMLESEHDRSSGAPGLGGGKSQRNLSLGKKVGLELQRYKLLFSSREMTRLTILVWLTYIMDYWGFTVAGTYLPKIIAVKNGSLNLSLDFTYRSYLLIYFPGVFGVALGALLYNVPHVGRKWTMAVSAGLMGASIFIFASVNTEASNIGLNAMEYFFQSMFNAVLYGWTPEAFPAPVRGTACGIASFWGRLFSIVSPLIAQSLYAKSTSGGGDINAVLYLAGGVTLGM
ncbi:putative membrane transporter [Diplodia seriata]|uniref:Putative membrane transporter n=1 Tax=Diplodia seriata TaxID=420778 RepID=A0A0G2GFG2_9PEZI|nr:putative membrane transporter [Diplodia seriata]